MDDKRDVGSMKKMLCIILGHRWLDYIIGSRRYCQRCGKTQKRVRVLLENEDKWITVNK